MDMGFVQSLGILFLRFCTHGLDISCILLTIYNNCKALNVVSLCVFQPSKFVQSFGVCCKQPLWNVLEITL